MPDRQAASDAALMLAVGRSDQEALEEIYRRHAGSVLNLAARVAGSSALAEEVVQDVFTTVWKSPATFDPAKGSLRTLLLSIGHRRAVDVVRSEVSRKRREGGTDVHSQSGSAEGEVLQMLQAQHVQQAMGALSDGERRAIELAYFGGHTYREVAQILDEPEGTVKTRIRAGLRRLRTEMVNAGVNNEN
ncbi:MAG TPA: sigma-70 family RNA polymerase sigma factor [Acidimicrobiales bacterium]|nr:sigma-70 family RNA polymerase sigma factor [Acidimicrobiales bacterium]